MIGNDVVDLALAGKESNWKREGFLDKIFTKKEQILILSSDSPQIMVWNLWSRKEAVYKIYNRQSGIRAFIPLQLECFEIGKVTCYGIDYYTKTEFFGECIHTIAVMNQADFLKIKTFESEYTIQKTKGIPSILENGNPVSISHHGRFEKRIVLKN